MWMVRRRWISAWERWRRVYLVREQGWKIKDYRKSVETWKTYTTAIFCGLSSTETLEVRGGLASGDGFIGSIGAGFIFSSDFGDGLGLIGEVVGVDLLGMSFCGVLGCSGGDDWSEAPFSLESGIGSGLGTGSCLRGDLRNGLASSVGFFGGDAAGDADEIGD